MAMTGTLLNILFGVLGSLFFLTVLRKFVPPSTMPIPSYYIRCILSFACLTLCALYGVIASIILRLVGYGGLSQWTVARSFKWTMRYAVGVQFVIRGEEHLSTRPAVFIGNHQTELDVLMLGALFPPYCSVTAKKQLKWVPFLGWFMALSKTVFIDRGNRQVARAAFDGAAHQMRSERQSVYIFPEGTRSYTSEPTMLPFKKGAFHLAIQAQVPIVAPVVANYSHILHSQTMTFNSGTIPVKVLPPFPTKGLMAADAGELMETVRSRMMEELVRLSQASRVDAINISSTDSSVDGHVSAKASGIVQNSAHMRHGH